MNEWSALPSPTTPRNFATHAETFLSFPPNPPANSLKQEALYLPSCFSLGKFRAHILQTALKPQMQTCLFPLLYFEVRNTAKSSQLSIVHFSSTKASVRSKTFQKFVSPENSERRKFLRQGVQLIYSKSSLLWARTESSWFPLLIHGDDHQPKQNTSPDRCDAQSFCHCDKSVQHQFWRRQ